MTFPTEILDRQPAVTDAAYQDWTVELQRSLDLACAGWVAALGPPGSDKLPRDRAWVLLSWVEITACAGPEALDVERLETAAVAFSLLEASPLDRRDVMVVASLLRHVSELAGLDFAAAARRGCANAGDLGATCAGWLIGVSAALPSIFVHADDARSPTFRRVHQEIDVDRLERWLKGE